MFLFALPAISFLMEIEQIALAAGDVRSACSSDKAEQEGVDLTLFRCEWMKS